MVRTGSSRGILYVGYSMHDVTQILKAIESGDARAASDLLPHVYDELRKLAGQRMKSESPNHTLAPTALVHEAYIRLVGKTDPGWQNRGHFFSAAAEAMRRILIESARRKDRIRHGGGKDREELIDIPMREAVSERVDVLALNDALEKLELEDSAKAGLVKLRFFAGLSVEEASAILGISRATADRWWTYSRAFLYCEMQDGAAGGRVGDSPPGGSTRSSRAQKSDAKA